MHKAQMQIIESEEKRLLDESLKKVDDYFSENGLLEKINDFCESDEVIAIIRKSQNSLISKMKKIEASAPEEVKSIAQELRIAFEKNRDSFRKDAIVNYKIRFYFSIKAILDLTLDFDLKKVVLEIIKEKIVEASIKDIKEICTQMVQDDTETFFTNIYAHYVPKDVLHDMTSFVSFISNEGTIIPFEAFFMDSESEEDEE